MTVEHNFDTKNFSWFDEVNLSPLRVHPEDLEVGLAVPQDSLGDLEWFPNFFNGFISLPTSGADIIDNNDLFTDSEYSVDPSSEHASTNDELHVCNSKEDSRDVSDLTSDIQDDNRANTTHPPWVINAQFGTKKKRTRRRPRQICKARPHEHRCSHCQTEKTPQWRAGPLGPKSLCNACGMRYKSGRLVPEYRPAASPSFDCRKHSNYHKRISRLQ